MAQATIRIVAFAFFVYKHNIWDMAQATIVHLVAKQFLELRQVILKLLLRQKWAFLGYVCVGPFGLPLVLVAELGVGS